MMDDEDNTEEERPREGIPTWGGGGQHVSDLTNEQEDWDGIPFMGVAPPREQLDRRAPESER